MDHFFDGLKDVAVWLIMLVFAYVGNEIRRARRSVERLNINVAVILEKIRGYEHRISALEKKTKKGDE